MRSRAVRKVVIVAAVAMMAAGACTSPAPIGTSTGGGVVTDDFYFDGVLSSVEPITYYYEGTAGESLNVSIFFDARVSTMTMIDPDGTETVSRQGFDYFTRVLPLDGQYRFVMRGTDARSFRYQFSLNHDLDGGSLTTGLNSLPPLLPAQGIHLSYDGTAGELLNIAPSWSIYVRVEGATVTDGLRRMVLPDTRTYEVFVRAGRPAPFPAPTLTLSNDIEAGEIGLGTTTISQQLLPEQAVVYTYDAAAGERVRVEVLGSDNTARVDVIDPTGVLSKRLGSAGTVVFPSAGRHELRIISRATPPTGVSLSHPTGG